MLGDNYVIPKCTLEENVKVQIKLSKQLSNNKKVGN